MTCNNPPSEVFSVPTEYKSTITELYAGLIQTELWQRVKGSCFCMAGFVNLAFSSLGHRTRVLPCYGIAVDKGDKFTIGYKNTISTPRQLDGHVVCLVDDKILVDFGLINISRYWRLEFPRAAAIEVNSSNIFPAELSLNSSQEIIWRDDWKNPQTEQVMTAHEHLYGLIYKQYKELKSDAQEQ